MEIAVSAGGFQHFVSLPSPVVTFPSISTAEKRKRKSSWFSFANTALNESQPEPAQVSSPTTTTTVHKTSLTPYSARRAAVVYVQKCVDLDSALARSGGVLQVQDLNVILRHFGKLNRWKDVSQLFSWMQKNGKVNVGSYSSYIKYMGRSLNPVKVLELYNSIQDESMKNNVSVCNSVLSCLVRSGKFESSIKLFDQMKQCGLVPDVVTYSTLLSGCIKVKHGYSKALQLVQELEDSDLGMDNVIYGTLIAICASSGQSIEAESYFERMIREGYSPNVFHYSSLLNAYSVDGNHLKADELMNNMKSAGIVPNKVILTTLLKVYVRSGLFEKSRELLSKLEALGYAKDEMPYCLLMDGLGKAGHIPEAKSIFDAMKEKDVKSDGYSYSIMISAFCRSKLLEEAKQLAREYESRYSKYDLVMLNTLLRAYCRTGEMQSVMDMLRKMDELTISPDSNTFYILIKYFCRENLYHLAYRMMEDMHNKGTQPDEELCSYLMLQLGKVGASSDAFSVYNMLRYSKRTMCKALHGKILNILVAGGLLKEAYVVAKDNAEVIPRNSLKKFAAAFAKEGNINMINDVLKAVHNSGHKIDLEVFSIVISRYMEQSEKKEMLLKLLQWMMGQGYVVDSTSRNLILKNSHLFGRNLIAEILSKQHKMSKVLRTQ